MSCCFTPGYLTDYNITPLHRAVCPLLYCYLEFYLTVGLLFLHHAHKNLPKISVKGVSSVHTVVGRFHLADVYMSTAGHPVQSSQIPPALTWALIFPDCLLSTTYPFPLARCFVRLAKRQNKYLQMYAIFKNDR